MLRGRLLFYSCMVWFSGGAMSDHHRRSCYTLFDDKNDITYIYNIYGIYMNMGTK